MQAIPTSNTFKAPLLHPKVISRLTLCRKYIYREFSIKVTLDQEDILEIIQSLSQKSTNPAFKQLALELNKSLPSH